MTDLKHARKGNIEEFISEHEADPDRDLEVVLVFRPVCSQLKMDQGLIYAAELIGSIFLS